MTKQHSSDDELDAALRELPVPELSTELRQRLEAIPARGTVRRFPVRSFRVPAFGWAAAAVLGLFIGAQSSDDGAETGGGAVVEAVPGEMNAESADGAALEDETVALAVGSLAEFEEEP